MSVETEDQQQSLKVFPFRDRLIVFAFSSALFCSALLMFLIQPLLGKMLLPKLGGSPQVWNTCMVFFQAVLFAGYLHAHYTGKIFGLRRQAAIHLILAFAAILALPIGLSNITEIPDAIHPVVWLMKTLMLSVGAPMFVISSTAPLLQKWFSHSRHPTAQDPYFLYAASNLGSLIALLSYPVFIEPLIGVQEQAFIASAGFVILVLVIAICAIFFYRNYEAPSATSEQTSGNEDQPVTALRRLRWLLLSFAPSSLLLGVTTYITTDFSAAPLFWILPLAFYLTTFVIVFARRPIISHHRAMEAQAILIPLVVIVTLAPIFIDGWLRIVMHLLAFFATALVCHGELVRTRPSIAHLTEFYLWLSLGGVLGGTFNALLAPIIFNQPFEYPLILALACMLRHASQPANARQIRYDIFIPLGLLASVFVARWILTIVVSGSPNWLPVAVQLGIMVPAGLVLISFGDRPIRLGLGVAAILVGGALLANIGSVGQLQGSGPVSGGFFAVERSFFGIYKVYFDETRDVNLLTHGTTVQSVQSRKPALATQPMSYIYRGGAFGDLFRALDNKLQNGNVAILGLGGGGLACYGTKASQWTYYEIDPLVEKLARDPRFFTYLRDCPPNVKVVIGDGRLMLRNAPDHYYDLIVFDAFSSASPPTHLLTKEAISGYLKKLKPNGVLALHISNRYLNLERIVGNLAHESRLAGRINRDLRGDPDKFVFTHMALLALLARNENDLGSIANSPDWRPLAVYPGERVWSDDYVNIFSVLGSPPSEKKAPSPLAK